MSLLHAMLHLFSVVIPAIGYSDDLRLLIAGLRLDADRTERTVFRFFLPHACDLREVLH